MIAITTKSSINVKPVRVRFEICTWAIEDGSFKKISEKLFRIEVENNK